MEKNVYTEQFCFCEDDIKPYGIRPFAVLSLFQRVATTHADLLGIGYHEMLKKNLLWVLMRIKFEILRQPTANEILTIKTYPSHKNMFELDRDFCIFDQNGEMIIKALSKWCLIDKTKRRISRMETISDDILDGTTQIYEERFLKLPDFEPRFLPDFVYRITDADIDKNGHANNTVYSILVERFLKFEKQKITYFEIDFLKETLLDCTLTIFGEKENNCLKVLGENENHISNFCAQVNFEPKENL